MPTARFRVALLAGLCGLAGCGLRPQLSPPQPATLAAIERLDVGICPETTAATLDSLRIAVADVTRITQSRRTAGAEREHLESFDTWVYRKDEPGAIVLRLGPDCALLTVYPTGGASLPNAAASG